MLLKFVSWYKFFHQGFTLSLAQELKGSGVTVQEVKGQLWVFKQTCAHVPSWINRQHYQKHTIWIIWGWSWPRGDWVDGVSGASHPLPLPSNLCQCCPGHSWTHKPHLRMVRPRCTGISNAFLLWIVQCTAHLTSIKKLTLELFFWIASDSFLQFSNLQVGPLHPHVGSQVDSSSTFHPHPDETDGLGPVEVCHV